MLKIENSLLILIDIQTKLWNVMSEKENLAENMQKLLKGFKVLGVPMIVTEQNPRGLGPTLTELKALIPDTRTIAKMCFSCREDAAFKKALEETNRRQVLLCGIESHICVYQTALDLLSAEFEVQIVADCVSSRVNNNKEIALSRMQAEGAKLTSYEMALYELLKSAESPKFKELLQVIK
jgi:nicotinamidase-related amidase